MIGEPPLADNRVAVRGNRVVQAYQQGRPSFGVYVRVPSPAIVELAAAAGLDFVRLDYDEAHLDTGTLVAMIAAAGAAGITPFVRVGRGDTGQIRTAVDLGSLGVIMPEVRSRADIEEAVRAMKAPPTGRYRPGISRATAYGVIGPADFAAWARTELLLGAQLETREAVDQIDTILTTPGLDMVLTGRGTLSHEFGMPGQRDHPQIMEIERMIIEKAQAAGKITSVTYFAVRDQGQRDLLREWIRMGVHSLCIGVDTDLIYAWRAVVAELRA